MDSTSEHTVNPLFAFVFVVVVLVNAYGGFRYGSFYDFHNSVNLRLILRIARVIVRHIEALSRWFGGAFIAPSFFVDPVMDEGGHYRAGGYLGFQGGLNFLQFGFHDLVLSDVALRGVD